MIFDNLNNCELYYGAHKNFEKAFDFIKTAIKEDLPVGKYEIDGKDLFASVQSYDSKMPEVAKNEGHKNYIDIQFVISGKEIIEVVDISKAVANTEYNSEKDVTFFENSDKANVLYLEDGEYAVLFPHDIHRPGMCVNGKSTPVKKIVVKVKL